LNIKIKSYKEIKKKQKTEKKKKKRKRKKNMEKAVGNHFGPAPLKAHGPPGPSHRNGMPPSPSPRG
jgi:hypothetical protein